MNELFLVGIFDSDDRFIRYAVSGRSGGRSCFTELISAKRCRAQLISCSRDNFIYKIIVAHNITILED